MILYYFIKNWNHSSYRQILPTPTINNVYQGVLQPKLFLLASIPEGTDIVVSYIT